MFITLMEWVLLNYMRVIKPRLILLAFTFMLLLITSRAYQNQALSFHFVDEEDNMVLGKYLLFKEKLYSNLFSHHQPLAYIASSNIQKITNPNTLYLLIKKHRETVIAWSVFWSLLLVARFGLPLFLLVILYEPLKVFLLGNLFLSESLVVYPFIYLASVLFLIKNNFHKKELCFLGFCFSLTFLLLTPLWPVLLAILAAFLYKLKIRKTGWLFMGMVPILFLTTPFVSWGDYWQNVFYINFKYYIPMTSKEPIFKTLVHTFLTPFMSFFYWTGRSATLQVIQLLSTLLLISWLVLMRKGHLKIVFLMFVILGFANLRYVALGQQSYSGFHLLPWFALLILISCISTFFVWQKYSGKLIKLFIVLIITGLGWTTLKETSQTLFVPKDSPTDFYINYSKQADLGQAIKIMKQGGETLFVVPDEWLIYWQADIAHASKMVNYYAWMADVPEIKNPLHKMFSENPPTYFYCDRCQFGYFGLEEFFGKYRKIKKDGHETNLMVLKKKLPQVTLEQKGQLSYYNFTIE